MRKTEELNRTGTSRQLLAMPKTCSCLLLCCFVFFGAWSTQAGQSWTYTLDGHFGSGELHNVNYTAVPDQLQVNLPTEPLPYINIACANRGTMIRIYTSDPVRVVGEYMTAPSTRMHNPSRTTVDVYGNCWIGNRDEEATNCGGTPMGSVVRIGMVQGGTRCNADGTANLNGQYLKPPFDHCTCEDRHGGTIFGGPDGLIKTSRGAGDILPWIGAGFDDCGGVATAEDECIQIYQRVPPVHVRSLAIDRYNDLWVGGYTQYDQNQSYYQYSDQQVKLSGEDGSIIPNTTNSYGCGGYGGLMGCWDNLWSARSRPDVGYNKLLRMETGDPHATLPLQCLDVDQNYGIAIDHRPYENGTIWLSKHAANFGIYKVAFDENTSTWSSTFYPGGLSGRGLAIDGAGHIWVAHYLPHSSPTVGHWRIDNQQVAHYIGAVDLTVNGGQGLVGQPIGLAVDSDQKIWAAIRTDNQVIRINPNAGPVINGYNVGEVEERVQLPTEPLPNGADPYNYSDMTGYQYLATFEKGWWKITQDSKLPGTEWEFIYWTAHCGVLTVKLSISEDEDPPDPTDFEEVSPGTYWTLSQQGLSNVYGRYCHVWVDFNGRIDSCKTVDCILEDLTLTTAGCDYQVRLSEQYDVLQGEEVWVEIINDTDGDYPECCIDTFTFDVIYDGSALDLLDVQPGSIFSNCTEDAFQWSVKPISGGKVVSIWGRALGLNTDCCTPSIDETFARLKFVVSNDYNLAGQWVPVSFYWDHCNDNFFSNADQTLPYSHVSGSVFSALAEGRLELTDIDASLPTGGGVPNSCLPFPPPHTTKRSIVFLNGGINIACADMLAVTIERTHNTIQGQHELVSITAESVPVDKGSPFEMGGFDFLIAYDASALALQTAVPGPAFYDPAPDGCGWEYFTFRYGPFGNCGDACPSGLVRVLGLAETNNGPNHPDCFIPDSLPATLFSLDFLVSNDRTLECQYAPVRFFWADCGDNSVSSVDGEVLYVSDHVYEFEGTEITDSTYGFPTYFGVQPHCLNPDPDKPTAIQLIDFWNGGVDIICADSIDDRGDINLNGVVNEVADAVLFSNYFVYGISVFNVNIDGQIAASDVNADGITLSVADLVYLIRIITGDAPPYPKLSPVTVEADLVDGVLSVNADMGAAYVVVENSVTPLLLAESMEMKYRNDEDNNLTRILVYSMEPDRRFSGDFLGGIDGNVMSLEMATYDGVPVTTKLVPEAFALYPCYPNPFNPITTISFALASTVDYELVIYNALGQTVETFSGRSGPGLERIDWNASGLASGVYFYRLTADDFSDTKKMVLLK